jgi:hypothetical protein
MDSPSHPDIEPGFYPDGHNDDNVDEDLSQLAAFINGYVAQKELDHSPPQYKSPFILLSILFLLLNGER